MSRNSRPSALVEGARRYLFPPRTAYYETPRDTVTRRRAGALQRYRPLRDRRARAAPVLLVNPLVVPSAVYDITPRHSGARYLLESGRDVWQLDFSVINELEGGVHVSFEDCIEAVEEAVDEVARRAGDAPHVLGYSQGGMFCALAAVRRPRAFASLTLCGTPADCWQSLGLPPDPALAAPMAASLERLFLARFERTDGIPPFASVMLYRVLYPTRELTEAVAFARAYPDEERLREREPQRLFSSGHGFAYWPGAALLDFIRCLLRNEMANGYPLRDGLRGVRELAVPTLTIAGDRDRYIRSPGVGALAALAESAEIHVAGIPTGHLGLVLGQTARDRTWPLFRQWLDWRDGLGERPLPRTPPDGLTGPFAPQFDPRTFAEWVARAFAGSLAQFLPWPSSVDRARARARGRHEVGTEVSGDRLGRSNTR